MWFRQGTTTLYVDSYVSCFPNLLKTKLPSKTSDIAQACQPALPGEIPEAVRDDQHKEGLEEEQGGHGLVQQGGHVKGLALEPDS